MNEVQKFVGYTVMKKKSCSNTVDNLKKEAGILLTDIYS